MSLTGFNLRRRKIANVKKIEKPVISENVVEEKVEEVKTEPTPSATKVVHKKTTKK